MAGVLLIEVAGGIWAHSLALLSDAGHVLTDLGVLVLTGIALGLVHRPATARKTFGYHRVGILIALLNAVVLAGIVAAIVVEAIRRLQHPAPVRSVVMMATAALALAAAGLIVRTLRPLAADLTVRSALIHVRGDALAATGVLTGGLLILVSGWSAVDPAISLAIAALIAWSAWQVLAAAVDILLESTPPDLDPTLVVQAVKRIPGVRDLHDLHLWSLAAQVRAMSAHILIDDQRVSQAQDILAEAREVLAHRFGIEHTTIQFEGVVCRAGDVFCVQPESHPHLADVQERMDRRALG